MLSSWNDGVAKRAIETFVERVTTPGSPAFVEPRERIAVFDNDGTLWCGKPMPVEMGFIYLDAHGFVNYIASGADRDFMRGITEEIYGVGR